MMGACWGRRRAFRRPSYTFQNVGRTPAQHRTRAAQKALPLFALKPTIPQSITLRRISMSIKILGRFAGCVSVLLLGILAIASPPPVHYHLLKKVPLGAAAGGGREYFDYLTVDSHGRRVYASHGTEGEEAEADSGALVGTMSGVKQMYGIALVE